MGVLPRRAAPPRACPKGDQSDQSRCRSRGLRSCHDRRDVLSREEKYAAAIEAYLQVSRARTSLETHGRAYSMMRQVSAWEITPKTDAQCRGRRLSQDELDVVSPFTSTMIATMTASRNWMWRAIIRNVLAVRPLRRRHDRFRTTSPVTRSPPLAGLSGLSHHFWLGTYCYRHHSNGCRPGSKPLLSLIGR
jgi:hypothetical protein